jgi:hypothetical protein
MFRVLMRVSSLPSTSIVSVDLVKVNDRPAVSRHDSGEVAVAAVFTATVTGVAPVPDIT